MDSLKEYVFQPLSNNLCKLIFTQMTLFIVVLGAMINVCESKLPVSVSRMFRYGKFACRSNNIIEYLEVPKSYFKHFYFVTAVLFYPLAINEVIAVYIFKWDPEDRVMRLLDKIAGVHRQATVNTTQVMLGIFLLVIQAYRRFYDTHYVSVFSPTAKMNIAHYIVGMIYYPLVMLTILIEAPIFANTDFEPTLRWQDIRYRDILATVIFLWAWYHQHICTVILANLRKPKKGNSETASSAYKIPKGDWFEYLSSPHCTAECIMYLCLSVILYGNTGWWFVLAWVLSNQTETMLLSHWWYKSEFPNYPKKRKALIPYVY